MAQQVLVFLCCDYVSHHDEVSPGYVPLPPLAEVCVYPDLLAFPRSPFWSQQTAFQLTCRNLLIFTFGVPRHVGTNGPPPQFCSSACEPQSEVISHNLSVHL